MGSQLRRLRQELNLSQGELALLLGDEITKSMISRHESGNRFPDLPTLLAYRLILGRDIHAIFPEVNGQIVTQLEDRTRELRSRHEAELPDPTAERLLGVLRGILRRLETDQRQPIIS